MSQKQPLQSVVNSPKTTLRKPPKIIQLTTPNERFKEFDRRLDKVLSDLDHLGILYTDLGFRPSDIEDLSEKDALIFKDELEQHARLVLALTHHPIISILSQYRDNHAVIKDASNSYPFPEGVWQHYKGTKYKILGRIQSTDFHEPGVRYQKYDQVTQTTSGDEYTITLTNFYKLVEVNGEMVKRFGKLVEY